jgi:hypothetical protein
MNEFKACKFCKSYDVYNGKCRENPPTVIMASEGSLAVWPDVKKNDWCGCFETDYICSDCVHYKKRLDGNFCNHYNGYMSNMNFCVNWAEIRIVK